MGGWVGGWKDEEEEAVQRRAESRPTINSHNNQKTRSSRRGVEVVPFVWGGWVGGWVGG